MANSTEEDYCETDLSKFLICISLGGTLALTGLLIQSFIVAGNFSDWLKRRSITSADQIITSIGISRIFYHTAFLLSLISMVCFPEIPEIVSTLTEFIGNSSTIANIWLSTLLSIFFYIKISTFHNAFLLCLKTFILERVTYLIVAFVLLSLIYTSLNYFVLPMHFFSNGTHNHSLHYTEVTIILYVNILWIFFPFLVFFIVVLLLIILLCFHMRRMNNGGNVTGNTDTYHRIITFTILSSLVCAFYLLINIFQMYMEILDMMWLYVIANIFPVVNSFLLIYVVMKLRNQFIVIVHCGTPHECELNIWGMCSIHN
uniref:Taste receptor type 2 n=1 Tax=Pyxicephalus adspersus TaxID=30357 RepID=A0AAV3AKD9_PYXAD|nr:TPA: hypothetical protein GDO54_009885 [Pyxicephalus adspersus]